MNKHIPTEIFLVAAVLLSFVAAYMLYPTGPCRDCNPNNKTPNVEFFCGTSTSGSCELDSDCSVGGCSNQICYSKNDALPVTTCEYRECYNAQLYNKKCGCINNACQWSNSVGLANPASEYCVAQGGQLKIVDEENGQRGICLINGKECDEWAFFNGECS